MKIKVFVIQSNEISQVTFMTVGVANFRSVCVASSLTFSPLTIALAIFDAPAGDPPGARESVPPLLLLLLHQIRKSQVHRFRGD